MTTQPSTKAAPPPPSRGRPAPNEAGIAVRYRRAQILGLLLVAAILVAAALARADMHALFPPGWWRF